MRVKEGQERIKWSKEHGHDTYFGGSDAEENACDYGDGVNQRKEKGSAYGKGKPRGKGKCAACGSSTHLRRDCPYNKSNTNKKPHSDKSTEQLIPDSESDEAMSVSDLLESGEDMSNGGSSDSQTVSCCAAEGRAHKRDCPMSSRNLMSGRTLFPV